MYLNKVDKQVFATKKDKRKWLVQYKSTAQFKRELSQLGEPEIMYSSLDEIENQF